MENIKVEDLVIGGTYEIMKTHISQCVNTYNEWHKRGDKNYMIRIKSISRDGFFKYDALGDDGTIVQSCDCYRVSDIYRLIKSPNSNNSKSIMSNIIKFWENLTLSDADKLLKKYGIEEPTGVPTALGLEMAARLNYSAQREAIIELAKKMEAEEVKKEEKK